MPNTRYIIEARNTVKVGESQFAQQVINTVAQVSNDYWELVYARENVKVEQATVGVDQQLYENNKKQLEIGTMAPLDVITAQSQLASDQQALVQAQNAQLQDETTLLVAITKDPLAMSHPRTSKSFPPRPFARPTSIENIPLADTPSQEAWQKRPELQQAALNLKNAAGRSAGHQERTLAHGESFRAVSADRHCGRFHHHNVHPDRLCLRAHRARSFSPTALPSPSALRRFPFSSARRPSTPAQHRHNAGLIDAWDNMIHNNYPTYEAGINVTLPIRNRAAQADNAQASLTQRQQQVQYRQTQNTIVLNVRQTLIALVQGRAAVAAAQEAETLAQQTLDDEQKKYQLGSSTSYNVVLRSRDLTAAQGTLLRDRIN